MGSVLSSAPKNVVVLGSSGSVGKATLKEITAMAKKTTIYAGLRDPTKLSAEDLGGAKAIKASMGSPELAEALAAEKAEVVVIVTPGSQDRAELDVKSLEACKKAGVKHVVVVSVVTAGVVGTVFGDQFTTVEKAAKECGMAWTLVRLPVFIDNYWGFAESIKGQASIYCPVDPAMPFSAIAVQDIGTALAKIALSPKSHAGKTYNLVTVPHTYAEVTAAIAKATGKEITYVRVPYQAAKEAFLGMGWPEWQTDGLLELFKMMDEGGKMVFPGGDFKKITGKDSITVEAWAETAKGGFM